MNHVDVHPTGRVALSVGKDQTLKMWDLMRGRGAASLALGQGELHFLLSETFDGGMAQREPSGRAGASVQDWNLVDSAEGK